MVYYRNGESFLGSGRSESGWVRCVSPHIKNALHWREQTMKNKWLHFSVDKETLFALACGALMILLSVTMMWLDGEVASIILRDALMIVLLGFFTPLYYIVVVKKQSPAVLGLHKNRLAASLAINIVAGGALLAMFIRKNTETIVFTQGSFYAVTYIFVAGIFEMVFIYGFLRHELERAFGILPAIFLNDVFFNNMAQGQGAAMALPIYGKYMTKVYEDQSLPYSQQTRFEFPAGIDLCEGSGYFVEEKEAVEEAISGAFD